ncbi:MAG: hypothetical protein HOP33_03360, partial [Verrucomicrobia bacterium]|nr:hypothetical protein [Verrucomicrobiota bacterium]
GFRPRDPQAQRDDRPTEPLPQITAAIVPDEHGVDSIARQIKITGRAFPLFDIAFLILQKPERYSIRFTVKKNAEGQPVQPMFQCALDDTLWLSEDEVVAHVLSKHFGTFYQAERIAAEPPKGVYTFVGQCGFSGVIFGPPNYHDYQIRLRKLHADKFSRMPFEMYKSRVKIVRDEAVVKQWVEELSWKTEYNCLNVPEPLKVATREDVEKHFRATHKETIIKPVENHAISGVACRGLRGGLQRVVTHLLMEQRRFPMQIATSLSQQFARSGLHFFKVNKTVTHVAVARPSYLDLEATLVSDSIKRIVDFINATPKCSRRKLVDALAPRPVIPAPQPAAPAAPAPDVAAASTESVPAPAPAAPEPTAEQTAVNADLHWLVHQGHVLEFANGILETAKKPAPKPPKPAAKPVEPIAPVTPVTTAVESTAEVSPVETATATEATAPVEPVAAPVESSPTQTADGVNSPS